VTSFNAPPNSTHSSDSQKLHIAANTPEAPTAPMANVQGPGFPALNAHNLLDFPPYYPPYVPPPNPYYPLYYRQPPLDAITTAHPYMPAPSFHWSEAPMPVTPGSPKHIVLPQVVLLAEFCNHYKIDDEDQARLAKLCFMPGNQHIEKLGRED